MRTLVGLVAGLAVSCAMNPSGAVDDDPADPPAGEDVDAAVVVVQPDAPPGPQPGDGVVWTTWNDQQARANPAWGASLTDVANHLPASYGSQYWDVDPVTASHETSHGIHAHLRTYVGPSGARSNAFYVLGDRAAFVVEPAIRKSAIAAHVPASLRGPRFSLYVTGQTAWDDTPLYIWDEWNAYVNGAEVGVDMASHQLWTRGWRDAVMGPLEFSAYALATAMAVKAGDPTYFASNVQFREFLAWNLRRAMTLYRAGRVMPDFMYADQDAFHEQLRTSADAEPMRRFARETYGEAWALEVLGF